MEIIGLLGFAQSGKDTVARFLVEERGYKQVAFADKLREMSLLIDPPAVEGYLSLKTAVEMHGWEYAKTYPEHRRFLQNLGVAARMVLDSEVWVNAAAKEMFGQPKVVISDVRFLNEIDWLLTHRGKLVRVDRPGVGPVNQHVSETEWNGTIPDAVITNNGTLEDLREQVKWVERSLW